MAPEGDAMIARGLYLSMKRSGKASLCWMLDWPLFYEQPFTRIKARALNEFLGAKLAPDCILMHGVRAVNWRNVSMDSGAYLADGVNLRSQGPIRIGRWTTIGPEVMLASGGHSTGDLAPTHSPITIGQGVFVGARALILEGVTIGNHAVIGAGAIVVRDVPPLAIAVGCPAKVVAYRDMPMRVWTVAGMIDLKGEVLQDVSSAPSCPAFSTHDAF
jgi:acetyltransferase-like isoleucine patch superfamily enzyme